MTSKVHLLELNEPLNVGAPSVTPDRGLFASRVGNWIATCNSFEFFPPQIIIKLTLE